MIRCPVLRSFFCSVIPCLIFYTAANVFYFDFSLKPRLLHHLLSHIFTQPYGDGRNNRPADERHSVPALIRSLADPASSNLIYEMSREKRAALPRQVAPLRVYMYDLPRKFTYGVLDEYFKARGLLNAPVSNDSELSYPGNQHSAGWWFFASLIKPPSDGLEASAIRVQHPSDAEVLYVPFFSSLSLVVNPVGSEADPQTSYSDEQMQEELIQWLEKQASRHRHRGRDHVVTCQDPNALHKVIERLKNCLLLVSDFGRLEPDQSSLVKDVIPPYSHRSASNKNKNATLERNTLLIFTGNRHRKEAGLCTCSNCNLQDTLSERLFKSKRVVDVAWVRLLVPASLHTAATNIIYLYSCKTCRCHPYQN